MKSGLNFKDQVGKVVADVAFAVARVSLGCVALAGVLILNAPQAQAQGSDSSATEADAELSTLANKALRITKLKDLVRKGSGTQHRKVKNTNYSGPWAGRYVLVQTNCTGFTSSFLFRHAIQLVGSSLAIGTSHDGTLLGRSRNAGRRLEASTQYPTAKSFVQVAMVYDQNSGMSAATGLAVRVTNGVRSCTAGYGAVAVRRFGF
jgi:hypothetical protein